MTVDALPDSSRTDFLTSPEAPHRTVLVALPMVEVPNIEGDSYTRRVRLTIHTDNMRILLSALSSLPELSELKIEGREITDQQFEELKRHRVYQFYMGGRLQRARFSNQQDVLVYLFPRDLNIDQHEAGRLLELPFSPSTLSRELGFKTFFLNARELVERWQRYGDVNALLPQLGGVNEFRIGSDYLSQRELEEIAAIIGEGLQEEQAINLNTANVDLTSLTSLSGAGSYQPLIMSKIPTKSNVNFVATFLTKIGGKENSSKRGKIFKKKLSNNTNDKIFSKK